MSSNVYILCIQHFVHNEGTFGTRYFDSLGIYLFINYEFKTLLYWNGRPRVSFHLVKLKCWLRNTCSIMEKILDRVVS